MPPSPSSLFEKNIALFKSRFPMEKNAPVTVSNESVYDIFPAKNGSPTARDILPAKEGETSNAHGVLLHSQYNPEREASKLVQGGGNRSAIFLAFGLGYAPVEWAKQHKGGALILIESSVERFACALHTIDWESVLRYPRLVIALDCPAQKVIPLIASVADIRECDVFSASAQTAHDAPYFAAVASLIERNKRKESINEATTKRFAQRWITNILRNASSLLDALPPSLRLHPLAPPVKQSRHNNTLAATILAAGPSLADVLPHLLEIKQHSIVIAVDTSLRASLRAGVEPDYVVLSDPQYYAWRHIAGLSSPSSVLVTDLAAYPAALRFDCKGIALAHSPIPLAAYFEKKAGLDLPSLGAGGSVASSAWNLAHLLGAKRIYLAGLDLSFPRGESHVRGSTAEEAFHEKSTRLCTAQNASIPAITSGNTEKGVDYNGNEVDTDSRMKMFAWWFESRLAEVKAAGEDVKTYTLCPKGLFIPGVETAGAENLLSEPPLEEANRGESNSGGNMDGDGRSAGGNKSVELSDMQAAMKNKGAGRKVMECLKQDITTLESLCIEAGNCTDTRRLAAIAQDMRGNALLEGVLFALPRIQWDAPAPKEVKDISKKVLKGIALLRTIAERSHIF